MFGSLTSAGNISRLGSSSRGSFAASEILSAWATDLASSTSKRCAAIANFNIASYEQTGWSAADIVTINEVPNSAAQSGTPGTPGSSPSGWAMINGTGLTRTIAYGVESGLDYVEIRLAGTTGDAAGFQVRFTSNTLVTALPGDVWTGSVYLALVAGSITNIQSIHVNTFERDASQVASNTINTDVKAILNATPQRFSQTRTLSGTAAYVQNEVALGIVNGVAVDITFRIYAPQLEKSATMTSFVRTTGSRAQRDISLPLNQSSFADLFTFTRASTATYIDASGLLVTAATNEPRFDYTNGKRQLLLEGPSTNAIKNSEFAGFAAGIKTHNSVGETGTFPIYQYLSWSSCTGSVTLISKSVDVKGRTLMRFAVNLFNSSGAIAYPRWIFEGTQPGTEGQVWSASAYIKVISSNQLCSFLIEGSSPYGAMQTVALNTPGGENYPKLQGAVFPAGSTTVRVQFGPPVPAGATWVGEFEVSMPQVELSPRCTSYIPTTGSAATRAADSCLFGPKMLALINRNEVGVVVRGQGLTGTQGRIIGGSSAGRIIGINTSQVQIGSGSTTFLTTFSVTTPLPAFGTCLSYGTGGRAMSYNSANVSTTATVVDNLPATSVWLGRDGVPYFANGWYDALILYPFRPTNTSVQTLSVAA